MVDYVRRLAGLTSDQLVVMTGSMGQPSWSGDWVGDVDCSRSSAGRATCFRVMLVCGYHAVCVVPEQS